MKTSAQNKEDLVLIEYFKGKRGGVFVDVGAHDGIQFSNTYLLETDYRWLGICIEPNPDSFKKLEDNRPHSRCFELATVNGSQKVTQLIIPNGVAVLGSTSQKPIKQGIAQILSIPTDRVSYQTQNVCCEQLSITLMRSGFTPGKKYELLSVDTEWTELEVLKSAHLDTYRPEVIVVEANSSEFAGEIEKYLKKRGYYLCGFVGGINYFYVNKQSNVSKMAEAISYVASGNCPNM
jgi:FkbM family methyltransferase